MCQILPERVNNGDVLIAKNVAPIGHQRDPKKSGKEDKQCSLSYSSYAAAGTGILTQKLSPGRYIFPDMPRTVHHVMFHLSKSVMLAAGQVPKNRCYARDSNAVQH